MVFPISAWFAPHDDFLFVHHAVKIGLGEWLGEYSNMTHAKGFAYSLFLLLNHIAGLPLKFTEQALYLTAALVFSLTMGRIYRSRWATLVTFTVLAFMSAVWFSGAGGRVVRESFYMALALFMLALGVRCWLFAASDASFGSPAEHVRQKWPQLLALGVIAGLFWLTREEGVWMLPSMAVLAAYWLWQQRKALRAWGPLLAFLLLPAAAMGVVVGTVNAINYTHYGVFRNNDFRSSDFQAGYGALTRIRAQTWQRYVLFPADARQRAYEMSAAARELQPYFEGPGAEIWHHIGCTQTETKPCPEILSGWFMWALRDAVAHAGHYRDARSAQAFYRRLAAEIEAGCQAKPHYCRRERHTLVPPWHQSYVMSTLVAAKGVYHTLTTLGGLSPDIGHSRGEAKYLAAFEAVTNGPLAPVAGAPVSSQIATAPLASPRDKLRFSMAQWINSAQARLLPIGLPLALAGWAAWLLAAAVRRRGLEPAMVVTTPLVAAVATRVLLLAFLEATSIPSNNMLYLLPVVPMALALLPVVFWGLLRFARPVAVGLPAAARFS